VDERRQLPIWQMMGAALALFLCGAIGLAPALAAPTDTPPGLAQPWDGEDENDGNDAHPAGGGHHDHDDDDDDHDDHDDDGGLELDDLLENLADVLEEVADLLDDLL